MPPIYLAGKLRVEVTCLKKDHKLFLVLKFRFVLSIFVKEIISLKNSLFLFLFFLSGFSIAQVEVELSESILQGIETEIKIFSPNGNELQGKLTINGREIAIPEGNSTYTFPYTFSQNSELVIQTNELLIEKKITPIPLWLSIIPPLLAILLALVFREVVTSLLIGIFSGALIVHLYANGFWDGILQAFMSSIDEYILGALNDKGHLSIIVFSMLIGGMVSIISKNGGMQGVVNRISTFATTPKNGQLATWFLGVAIFFDDYANTLIVGNTMRSVTDRLKISREKLAYLVDSTAAPMASIAFVTTWIGAELGYIQSGIENIDGLNEGVYSTFISSLAYSFYPILALAFMLILILKERDFGPMFKAEQQARHSLTSGDYKKENKTEIISDFSPIDGVKERAYNAIIPVALVIIGTIIGLLYTGWDPTVWSNTDLSLGRKLSSTIGSADSYQALLWSSLAGLIVAIKLSVFQKIMNLPEAVESAIQGFKTMLPAIIILILAWGLSAVIDKLHTADLLTSLLSENISPYFIPAITFILAALVAFSTGSSWGTMAILYPLMLPLAWSVCMAAGFEYELSIGIFHNTVACVLAGSVLGDHCSPISDTTILSSLASSCNHIDHVRTQMPYALVVGITSILLGTIPSAFGSPFWLNLFLSLIALYFIVHFLGKNPNDPIKGKS